MSIHKAHAREPLRGEGELTAAVANLQHSAMRMRDSLLPDGRERFDATPQEFTVRVNLADLMAVLESFEAQPAVPAADEAVGAYTIDAEPLPNHRRIFSDHSGGTLSFDRGTANIEVMDRLSKLGKLMDTVLDLLSVRTTGGHYRDFAEAAEVYENRVRLASEQIAAVLPNTHPIKPLRGDDDEHSTDHRAVMRSDRALRDIRTTVTKTDTDGLLLPDTPRERLEYNLAMLDRVRYLSERGTYGLPSAEPSDDPKDWPVDDTQSQVITRTLRELEAVAASVPGDLPEAVGLPVSQRSIRWMIAMLQHAQAQRTPEGHIAIVSIDNTTTTGH